MKAYRNSAAAAAAILGLAFCESGMAEEPASTAGDIFAALDNTALADPAMSQSFSESATVGASGAALEQAAATTDNSNTGEVATTLFDACAGGENRGTAFGSDCTLIVQGGIEDPTGTSQALLALTPDQVLAPRIATLQQVKAGIGVAEMRMSDLRLTSGVPGFATNEELASGLLFSPASGGGASADVQFERGAVFFNLKYLETEQDRDPFTSGYDMDGVHLTFGADYRLRDNLIAGVFGSYTTQRMDYWQDKGAMEMDGWGIGVYGTYYWEGGAFLEGTLGYDSNSYDLNRRIDYRILDTEVHQTARSSPEAEVVYASLGAGYSIARQSFTITPAVSLNYTQNTLDGYRETMSNPLAPGGSLAMAYDTQTYTSLTSRVGVMVTQAISTRGGVILPQLSIDWVHEYQSDQEQFDARYLNDLSNTPMSVLAAGPDQNYYDLGLGVSGQFAHGRSAFLSVNLLLDYDDVTTYSVTGGFRIEF